VTFVPDAVVHHRSSATSDLLGLYNRGFLFERNAFLTAYKNYEPGLWEKVMPALLLTFLSRTQTLLAQHNPGGGSLTIDPYAGWIANTAAAAPVAPPEPLAVEASTPEPAREPWTPRRVVRRFGELGPREAFRRGLRKLLGRIGRISYIGAPAPATVPTLTDERTVAQLRALNYLLRHVDEAAAKRAAVQRRRRRSDAEIFAKFPLYLVPTYPGDAELFQSPGFAAWLPAELPLVRSRLPEIMEMG
jgi:hypothetical protein